MVPYDLDVSPDGTLLSAGDRRHRRPPGAPPDEVEDLLAGKMEPVAHFEFGTFLPLGFVFSDDGRYLYGSSYYTGVSNVFRYEIATGKLDALTNTEPASSARFRATTAR